MYKNVYVYVHESIHVYIYTCTFAYGTTQHPTDRRSYIYIYLNIYTYIYLHIYIYHQYTYTYITTQQPTDQRSDCRPTSACSTTSGAMKKGVPCKHIVKFADFGEISRLLKITVLFCNRALKKKLYFAKETYDCKEPTEKGRALQTHRQITLK